MSIKKTEGAGKGGRKRERRESYVWNSRGSILHWRGGGGVYSGRHSFATSGCGIISPQRGIDQLQKRCSCSVCGLEGQRSSDCLSSCWGVEKQNKRNCLQPRWAQAGWAAVSGCQESKEAVWERMPGSGKRSGDTRTAVGRWLCWLWLCHLVLYHLTTNL